MLVHCQIMELGKMSGRASRTSPATGVADPAARLEDLARRRAVAGNAWCPRLTAAMILSSAVHVKGFGSAFVSAEEAVDGDLGVDDGAEEAAFQATAWRRSHRPH